MHVNDRLSATTPHGERQKGKQAEDEDQERLNEPMKDGVVIRSCSAKGEEVLGRFRYGLAKDFELEVAQRRMKRHRLARRKTKGVGDESADCRGRRRGRGRTM
jgi:hypothetical protein